MGPQENPLPQTLYFWGIPGITRVLFRTSLQKSDESRGVDSTCSDPDNLTVTTGHVSNDRELKPAK